MAAPQQIEQVPLPQPNADFADYRETNQRNPRNQRLINHDPLRPRQGEALHFSLYNHEKIPHAPGEGMREISWRCRSFNSRSLSTRS